MKMNITEEDAIKLKVQRVIVTLSTLILIGKFEAFYITNSVGVLTDAMESIVNVTMGFVSLYSLRWAAQPKDKSHPFGHGKMELISASLEGLLIGVAGGMIIYEGVHRLFCASQIEKLDVGIWVVAIAGVINYLMGWYSIKMGRKYNSMALVAGGRHLQSDTYSTIGLVIGLLILYFTGIAWIDCALAILFGLIIAATGISILRKTIGNLLDEADNATLNDVAQAINEKRTADWIDVHNTKVIKYGSYLYIDCDLTLPWFYNVRESHDACDKLKKTLSSHFSERVQVSIHTDPCEMRHCHHCEMQQCPSRDAHFDKSEPITLDEITQSDDERGEE